MALPLPLTSFCEKLTVAVTNAGRHHGWLVQQFGRGGLNCDVIVGRVNLKITTGGKPAADGSGAMIRLHRTGHERIFGVRAGANGDLELTDDTSTPVSLDRFVELVGEGCEAPIRKTFEIPTPLARLCERLATAVVSTGSESGWRVQQFGRGFNADVVVGSNLLKITTEGTPLPDGTGAVFKLRRGLFDRGFGTRVGRDGDVELTDESGHRVSLRRFVEIVGEGCGAPLHEEEDLPAVLVRFYEKLASTVVKAGQDNGWRVQQFGKRGFNCDVSVGPNIVKVTTDGKAKHDGSGASIWFKRPGFEHTFITKANHEGDLDLTEQNGAPVSLDRFIEILAEASNTRIKESGDYPMPLNRLCEKIGSTIIKAGQDNGWRVQQFGQRGFNCDVAVGPNIVKVTTEGKPEADGSGAQIRIVRPGYEQVFTTRRVGDADLEIADSAGNTALLDRFLQLLAEATNTPLKEAIEYPMILTRFCEKLGSTVVAAGQDNGWRVQQFGKNGFNADVAIGSSIVKVTTEGRPAADGSGVIVRIARSGYEKVFVTRAGREELELVEQAGGLCRLPKFIEHLAEACNAQLKRTVDLAPQLRRLCERLASTVGTAGSDNGWRVTQFGSKGYNADLAVGSQVVKVTLEGKPGHDGSGAVLRVKGLHRDRVLNTRMGQDAELELIEDGGQVVTLNRLTQLLKDSFVK